MGLRRSVCRPSNGPISRRNAVCCSGAGTDGAQNPARVGVAKFERAHQREHKAVDACNTLVNTGDRMSLERSREVGFASEGCGGDVASFLSHLCEDLWKGQVICFLLLRSPRC